MLFNKNNQGSEELYEISGTFHAATDYRSVESEVESATQEVAMVVGESVVAKAEELYQAENVSGDEKAFIRAVQKPVAFLAISLSARLSGLSHGETGRKMKVDDNEKIPFEWMIDRDDREMRERYYRALDTLFIFLDRTSEGSSWEESWEESPAKKLTGALIIKTLWDAENIYPMEHSRYMFYKLAPVMLEIQDTKLKSLIGEERLEKLIEGDDEVANIAPSAKRYTLLNSMATAIQRWSIDAFPLSIQRRFHPTYQGNRATREAATEEIDWYLEKLALQVKDAEVEMMTEVSGNPYEGMRLIPENHRCKKYFTV